MKVPEDFATAYGGLVELVRRVSAGEVGDEGIGEEVDRWRRGSCRGAGTLARSTMLALRYELASRGLREGPAGMIDEVRSLSRVEAAAKPPEASVEGSEARIVEAAVPEQMRRAKPGIRGFRMGPLQIYFEKIEGPPFAHLSVSHPSRHPTFEELMRIRSALGENPPTLWARLPKPEQVSGAARYVVNLYVRPPNELLG